MDPVEAFETLAATQLELAGVTRRTMFGRDTLLADGHPYAFRDDDRVALKLPDADQLAAAGQATVPMMGRQVMRRWAAVPLEASDELTTLLAAAREHVTR